MLRLSIVLFSAVLWTACEVNPIGEVQTFPSQVISKLSPLYNTGNTWTYNQVVETYPSGGGAMVSIDSAKWVLVVKGESTLDGKKVKEVQYFRLNTAGVRQYRFSQFMEVTDQTITIIGVSRPNNTTGFPQRVAVDVFDSGFLPEDLSMARVTNDSIQLQLPRTIVSLPMNPNVGWMEREEDIEGLYLYRIWGWVEYKNFRIGGKFATPSASISSSSSYVPSSYPSRGSQPRTEYWWTDKGLGRSVIRITGRDSFNRERLFIYKQELEQASF